MTSQRSQEAPTVIQPPSHIAIPTDSPTLESTQSMSTEGTSATDGQTTSWPTVQGRTYLPCFPEPQRTRKESRLLGTARLLSRDRRCTIMLLVVSAMTTDIDWIVRVELKRESVRVCPASVVIGLTRSVFPHPKTLQERLDSTLDIAKSERNKYVFKAKMTGHALNVDWLLVLARAGLTIFDQITTGLQVILGALTTGLAAVISRQHRTSHALGGSNEPELSIARWKDLDQYIRECEVLLLAFDHTTGNEHDVKLNAFRSQFEELLVNGSG
ncbi:hypothetical protein C8R43DRAFT_965315 [Mycena crocata]|nr:hypothetical protein C8R43DRAFT_965315 [Mycena crocata]